MRQWIAQMDPREQRLLGIGLFAVLVIALAGLVWLPLNQRREALAERVAAQRDTLAWMQEASERVLAARRAGESPTRQESGDSLLSIIDSGARGRGFADNLRRAEPEGDSRVRVWLAAVDFDSLAGWLEALDRQHGVRATELTVTRVDSGRVDARLTLEGG